MWNCTLTTVHQGISQGGRYWVTIDTFPHCRMFLWHFYWFTDYCGAGDEDEGEPVLESFSEDFQQPLTHSRICSLTHPLTRAVALSFVLFSAVVTKASNFVANFKQIFRFALPLSLCSLSHSLCYCSVSYVRKVRFNLLKFLLFNFIKSTVQNKSECRKKS